MRNRGRDETRCGPNVGNRFNYPLASNTAQGLHKRLAGLVIGA
jgi:hypothetical protein